MWWLFIIMILLILFSKIDDINELFKRNNPNYRKEKEQERHEQLNKQLEIMQRLKQLIGEECQLESNQLYLMSLPNKVQARILAVDEGWVEFTVNKKKKITLVLKIEDIIAVSRIL